MTTTVTTARERMLLAKDAARTIGLLDDTAKRDALLAIADAIEVAAAQIVAANAEDLRRGRENGLTESLQDRLRALGGAWGRVTTIDVYTAHPIHAIVEDEILRAAGPAAIHGVHWYPSRPPIEGLEFEMDLRGVVREIVL